MYKNSTGESIRHGFYNNILRNAIETPDGTFLHSKHTHDYKEYKDKNGEFYMVDGGNMYFRGSVNNIPAKSMHLTFRSKINLINNYVRLPLPISLTDPIIYLVNASYEELEKSCFYLRNEIEKHELLRYNGMLNIELAMIIMREIRHRKLV